MARRRRTEPAQVVTWLRLSAIRTHCWPHLPGARYNRALGASQSARRAATAGELARQPRARWAGLGLPEPDERQPWRFALIHVATCRRANPRIAAAIAFLTAAEEYGVCVASNPALAISHTSSDVVPAGASEKPADLGVLGGVVRKPYAAPIAPRSR
jgi:hypothetical protein